MNRYQAVILTPITIAIDARNQAEAVEQAKVAANQEKSDLDDYAGFVQTVEYIGENKGD